MKNGTRFDPDNVKKWSTDRTDSDRINSSSRQGPTAFLGVKRCTAIFRYNCR